MLNHVSIMGRLARVPELRRTQAGTAVTSFTIACERDFEQNGERVADFFDCVAWRGTGEFIERNFDQGQMIAITGRLQVRNWTDKMVSGTTKQRYLCRARTLREASQAVKQRQLQIHMEMLHMIIHFRSYQMMMRNYRFK